MCKRELYQSGYNPKQRNPALAGGQYCQMTELRLLAQHSHPTIALYAQKLINGEFAMCSVFPFFLKIWNYNNNI